MTEVRALIGPSEGQGGGPKLGGTTPDGLRLRLVRALLHQGAVLAQKGRMEEALARYQRVLALDPSCLEAALGLGQTVFGQGRVEASEAIFRCILERHPGSARARNSLGLSLQARGELSSAEASFRSALGLEPGLAAAQNNLANLLARLGRADEAIRAYRRALSLEPEVATIHENLGNILKLQGRMIEAARAYRRAGSIRPGSGLLIKEALLLPPIYGTRAEIRRSRRRFRSRIKRLLSAEPRLTDPLREVGQTNFYLAYQGFNDRAVQEDLARLYRRALPPAKPAPVPRRAGRRPRLGFISAYLNNHTIGKLMRGLIAHLPRDEFEIHVFNLGRHQDHIAGFISEVAEHSHSLPRDLERIREAVSAVGPDLIYFPEIGMDPATYFLALGRLAPIQCTTWGHPVTSGMETMDYFVSSRDLETPLSRNHYTEELVRLESLGAYYYRPQPPQGLQVREELGFPRGERIYFCPQSLFKLHPDFDPVLNRILEADGRGRLVLIEGPFPAWKSQLLKRFQRTMPRVWERISFLPRLAYSRFLGMMAEADVVLDTFPFCGGNTTLEGLAVGAPIVTLPTSFLRGRISYALYRRMGVLDCVAQDEEDYSRLAVRLAREADFRETVRARILERNQVLYEDLGAVKELAGFFHQALERAGRR